jgi:hypothetical protein
MILLGKILKEHVHEFELGKFVTFPDEKIIMGVREHYVFLIFRIIKIFLSVVAAAILISLVLGVFLQNSYLVLFTLLLTAFIGLSFILQAIVHWHFHLYVATNRKILELTYHPLVSEQTNSVLLDQIKCTEIDAEVYGFIPELLNMGDVKITFDRPTHHDEFVLKNIRSPRKIANILSIELNKDYPPLPTKNVQRLWYKDRLTNKFRFMEQNYGYSVN